MSIFYYIQQVIIVLFCVGVFVLAFSFIVSLWSLCWLV